MFYELRRYQIEPGRRDEWVQLMDSKIVPFQQSQGMDIIGTFLDEADPDVFIWMRRFENEEQRVAQYKAVYESDTWTQEIAPVSGALLRREHITVTRLVPTPTSALK